MGWQSGSGDADSARDAEVYKRESETGLFNRALHAPLDMLFWSPMAKACFEYVSKLVFYAQSTSVVISEVKHALNHSIIIKTT